MKKNVLVTGAAGFIGSNFLKRICLANTDVYNFVIVDALTYAGCYETIEKDILENESLFFEKVDIRNANKVKEVFNKYDFKGVVHFAAESHVDRSIENPNIFVETNILGTLNLLNESLKAFESEPNFKFLHVSTDEVYGDLSNEDPAFTELTPLHPNSPYSASKAGSDHLVQSFFHTYGLPILITRCSNNYGPFQFPEKLIPLMINNAISNKKLPVYGDGKNIRDWIHVHDHVDAIWTVWSKGISGEVYNVGGKSEVQNIEVVKLILKHLGKSEDLISYVKDRLGHDRRYAIDNSKIQNELGWVPKRSFDEGLSDTISWYKENIEWLSIVSEMK
ncbi:MAG: dTDP-glucose 4,6-dehydratase [Bacteriovoracaceae bacterium]|jgi:dTDP-glucose 4,6-dehydratase